VYRVLAGIWVKAKQYTLQENRRIEKGCLTNHSSCVWGSPINPGRFMCDPRRTLLVLGGTKKRDSIRETEMGNEARGVVEQPNST
jgi:hypothetical protein